MYKIWNEDCISGMSNHISDNTIDLIITDPPYGIDGDKLDKHYARDESYAIPGYVDVPLKHYGEFSSKWIKECDRCLKPGGSIYIISGYTNLHHILNALHSTSLKEINHLIWQYGFGVATTKKYVSSHYHILYWYKPPDNKRIFNTNCRFTDITDSYHDRESVFEISRKYKPGVLKNKNQLPEELVERLLLYSSNRGSLVMDPFMGGFTTANVAIKYGRNVTGFEMNENAFQYFEPLLSGIEVLESDPTPIDPDPIDLEKRIKMRTNRQAKRNADKEKSAIEEMFVL